MLPLYVIRAMYIGRVSGLGFEVAWNTCYQLATTEAWKRSSTYSKSIIVWHD
jgi:hypothetical protein